MLLATPAQGYIAACDALSTLDQRALLPRIRRSTLVNLKRVASAEKCAKGALAFNLCSGTRLVSRIRFKFDGSTLSSEKLSF